MRVIRPFDVEALAPGAGTGWLIGPEEDLGVSIEVRRGDGTTPELTTSPSTERFAFVLEGKVQLLAPEGSVQEANAGDLVFIPAGQAGGFAGDASSVWVFSETQLQDDSKVASLPPMITRVDPSKYKGGFESQKLASRDQGSQTMRFNALRVTPGVGSPDYHIHNFAQIYLIQEGELTVDIGRRRMVAGRHSLVVLPSGLVHRNFNASDSVERHVSYLVPEPKEKEIFDYAVNILDVEAERLTSIPD